MKNTIQLSIYFLFTVILMSHCKKNDNPTTPTTTSTTSNNSTGTLYFHLHTNIDTNEVGLGDTAKTADGRKMVLSMAQLYASGFRIYKSDGSFYTVNTTVLKTADSEVYMIGTVPAGNYATAGFNVGVDSATNATSPTSYPAGTPLAAHTPPMWFSSTAQGYIFVNVSGFIDTSASKNGKANFPFSYKIGSNALLQSVKLPVEAFTISPTGVWFVHVTIDYSLILKGLNMATENKTDTYTTNPSLAKKVAANIPGMFRYEQ